MTKQDIVIYCGIAVFALTGALKARQHQMDIFGAFVLAFVTAYGGGTIRDILIDAKPINWMNDNIALILVILPVIIVSLLKFNFTKLKRLIFITDAMGLGLFTVAGIDRSMLNGINDPFCVFMGVVTACFGGLVADILCNNVPTLLRKGELYATASAIGGLIYLLSKKVAIDPLFGTIICVILIIIIRIISKWKRVMLPDI